MSQASGRLAEAKTNCFKLLFSLFSGYGTQQAYQPNAGLVHLSWLTVYRDGMKICVFFLMQIQYTLRLSCG